MRCNPGWKHLDLKLIEMVVLLKTALMCWRAIDERHKVGMEFVKCLNNNVNNERCYYYCNRIIYVCIKTVGFLVSLVPQYGDKKYICIMKVFCIYYNNNIGTKI